MKIALAIPPLPNAITLIHLVLLVLAWVIGGEPRILRKIKGRGKGKIKEKIANIR